VSVRFALSVATQCHSSPLSLPVHLKISGVSFKVYSLRCTIREGNSTRSTFQSHTVRGLKTGVFFLAFCFVFFLISFLVTLCSADSFVTTYCACKTLLYFPPTVFFFLAFSFVLFLISFLVTLCIADSFVTTYYACKTLLYFPPTVFFS
jgi:hypothetical protein